jgi:hypothetical protein
VFYFFVEFDAFFAHALGPYGEPDRQSLIACLLRRLIGNRSFR